jgi:hypothetical protein
MPISRDAMPRPIENRASLEEDVTAIGRVESAGAIEECRLAGAIGTDQTEDGAGRHIKADAVERYDAAEADVYVAYGQNWLIQKRLLLRAAHSSINRL